jgi:hypothetical protein
MPKRTIQDARTALERDLAPTLNDHAMREHQAVLAQAEAVATGAADQRIAAQEQSVLAARDAALHALTDTRDAMDELRRHGATGRVAARDYQAQLASLRQQQASAEQTLAKAEEQVEVIAAIEADPVAWFDALCQRQPTLMRSFPW